MIVHKRMELRVKEEEVRELKNHYQKVIQHLEKGFPLKVKVLEELKASLSRIVKESRQWQEVLKAINRSGDYYCLHLLHEDNEILNLPWSMVIDNITDQPLGSIRRLYLTKGIPDYFKEKGEDFPKAAAPLKVLMMISSLEDAEWKQRLSYEEEEFQILKAFEPLMQSWLVEVDFTEDGSLETLERKLKENQYHILHFSGHGVFVGKENIDFLVLEHPLTLKTHKVAGADFAEVVNCNPIYKVPMVVLSSCQTAQGSVEKGLRGVTNHLLRVGVPIVISMGMSIRDDYAAFFASGLYRRIGNKETVLDAFNEAVKELKEKEFQESVERGVTGVEPLNWIIPNLYLSQDPGAAALVDWKQPEKKLKYLSNRFIFEKDRLLLAHEEEYLFIGRRKEKAAMLKPFFNKTPVLLKGQGGVGKTAMAEHLVQRLIAKNPNTIPFVFNEKTKSIEEILNTMRDFLLKQRVMHVISGMSQFEKGMEKFLYLLSEVEKTYQPVFVFDNLESFQVEPGKEFSGEFSDIKEIIDYLCEREEFHVILTCRYPVADVKHIESFDLNQVGLNDFWKKCLYMDVGYIRIYLREKASFEKAKQGFLARPGLKYIDVVKLLHETFGGNYRALEFFDRSVKEEPHKIVNSLDSFEKFLESSKEITNEVKQKMGQDMLFSQLMALLEPQHRQVLDLLSHFRVPMREMAVGHANTGTQRGKTSGLAPCAGIFAPINVDRDFPGLGDKSGGLLCHPYCERFIEEF
ncbi:MAG: CHAT domain-containing protein [Candidatus Aminicenantes bacterium]|nr:CHAT domain-containing protein [Candidatus Aminicenantes bacterium]NIM81102.1 CHAT domain-containing protein [Candidatus Aminicenantes bacterium]NIN20476.1 CHAT domain-containing protein [Candidatus Aminicenantes bacterium]NIN44249.1 CHAT domain-containing protein [Candidatus Aminicenantes bacterium]NIN87068.1 CHAT domain-containing protein [Candidatus Aminicenantes bacterium]